MIIGIDHAASKTAICLNGSNLEHALFVLKISTSYLKEALDSIPYFETLITIGGSDPHIMEFTLKQIKRAQAITSFLVEKTKDIEVQSIVIEGPAFESKGSSKASHPIALALLIASIKESPLAKIPINIVAPKSLKKFVVSGNASKELIVEKLLEENIAISYFINSNKNLFFKHDGKGSHCEELGDIADSYFLTKMFKNE